MHPLSFWGGGLYSAVYGTPSKVLLDMFSAQADQRLTADECQPWMNFENNGNEYLIIGTVNVVHTENSHI